MKKIKVSLLLIITALIITSCSSKVSVPDGYDEELWVQAGELLDAMNKCKDSIDDCNIIKLSDVHTRYAVNYQLKLREQTINENDVYLFIPIDEAYKHMSNLYSHFDEREAMLFNFNLSWANNEYSRK